jgi:hypothetical protein
MQVIHDQATIYHPPRNDDYLLRNHIYQNFDKVLNNYPNSGIILLGDFNQFNPGSLCTSFKLKKLVHFPTRGSNTLDQIYSSLINFYDKAKILPPVAKSDNACILLEPTVKTLESFPNARTLPVVHQKNNHLLDYPYQELIGHLYSTAPTQLKKNLEFS